MALQMSHLFFADDTLLFCHAKLRDIQTIQNILARYEEASRQHINREKTNLFFGKLVYVASKNYIISLLGLA